MPKNTDTGTPVNNDLKLINLERKVDKLENTLLHKKGEIAELKTQLKTEEVQLSQDGTRRIEMVSTALDNGFKSMIELVKLDLSHKQHQIDAVVAVMTAAINAKASIEIAKANSKAGKGTKIPKK